MQSKCFLARCGWVLEVAHMDEALDQLRQHYRAIHPTKAMRQNDVLDTLETYNLTADEVMGRNNLNGDNDPVANYDWGHIRAQAQRWRQDEQRYGSTYYNPDTIAEVERRVEEHFANAPAVADQPPAVQAYHARLDNIEAAVRAVVPPFDQGLVLDDVLEVDPFQPFQGQDGGNV